MKNAIYLSIGCVLFTVAGVVADSTSGGLACTLFADGMCTNVIYTVPNGPAVAKGEERMQFQVAVPRTGTSTLYKGLPGAPPAPIRTWAPATTPQPGDNYDEPVSGPAQYSFGVVGATPSVPPKLYVGVSGTTQVVFASVTPTFTPTGTTTDTPTVTPTNTPTRTNTNTPTNTPTVTPTPTVTNTPTNTPTSTPTATPTVTPTATATVHTLSVIMGTGTPGTVDVTIGGVPQVGCSAGTCNYTGVPNSAAVVLFAHGAGGLATWGQTADQGCDGSTNATCSFTMPAAAVSSTANWN